MTPLALLSAGLVAAAAPEVRAQEAATVTALYTFSNGSGYSGPLVGGLVKGRDGNFYGITGGNFNINPSVYGTVYRVSPAGEPTILHTFSDKDGGYPQGGLVQAGDGNFYGTTESGTAFKVTPAGVFTTLANFNSGTLRQPTGALAQASDGSFYGTVSSIFDENTGTIFKFTLTATPAAFFTGEAALANGVYYLSFNTDSYFGYYSYLSNVHYVYHFDLGYEYLIDANDGQGGVYLYDFSSNDFFYTSPAFPFPYLYDFNLNSVVYYYPDPNNAGHYNTDGMRYFYVFNTGAIITK